MSESSLIPPRFMFRFAVDLQRCDKLWSAQEGALLDESYRLPALAQLDDEPALADVRMAWSPQGLVWWVRVEGKRQLPWCRESRLDESDGLQVWVDTRATTNVHRASRFCHRFVFLPRGGGRSAEEPVADQLLINRARVVRVNRVTNCPLLPPRKSWAATIQRGNRDWDLRMRCSTANAVCRRLLRVQAFPTKKIPVAGRKSI